MASNSRSVVELNELIDRLDSLILVLSTATGENATRLITVNYDSYMILYNRMNRSDLIY